MSCETPAGGFSHLDVKSTINAAKCKLSRGASARHSVKVTNYAAVELEVEIECVCPAGVGLEHACGSPWKPAPRSLRSGLGVDSTTFDEDLCAAADAGAPARQQLKLTVRRRRLHATKWTWSKTVPLKDLEVV